MSSTPSFRSLATTTAASRFAHSHHAVVSFSHLTTTVIPRTKLPGLIASKRLSRETKRTLVERIRAQAASVTEENESRFRFLAVRDAKNNPRLQIGSTVLIYMRVALNISECPCQPFEQASP